MFCGSEWNEHGAERRVWFPPPPPSIPTKSDFWPRLFAATYVCLRRTAGSARAPTFLSRWRHVDPARRLGADSRVPGPLSQDTNHCIVENVFNVRFCRNQICSRGCRYLANDIQVYQPTVTIFCGCNYFWRTSPRVFLFIQRSSRPYTVAVDKGQEEQGHPY